MSNYTFATLYDTANRIPVFSAYEYTGVGERRPGERWKIERQLEPSGADMKVPFVHQASNRDYCSSDTKNKQVDRGHLFPSSHANNNNTKKSTFTLTNAVPQKKSFNSGSWCDMENKVRDLMNKHCRHKEDNNRTSAYVLTGAVPGTDTMNDRVNIPSYMWTAFCCYNRNSWVSQAHWAENVDEKNVPGSSRDERHAKGGKKNKKNNQIGIPSISLEQLHQILSTFWPNIQLFANCTNILNESSLLGINTEHDYGQDESCKEMDAKQCSE
ncbi:endonuclease domain-containing 1 protein-like [Cyprinus carpio]|nr:endonuclease domain-containing 1 protein-like [Cyprinus carpio]